MFRRFAYFIAMNLAIMVTLTVIMVGVDIAFPEWSADLGYWALIIIPSVFWGFGGAILSLVFSKWMAKSATGARVITTPQNQQEAWLLQTVQNQARHVGIGMPEVAIYESGEVNAFATGPTKSSSLVAVSRGLLNGMNADEVEAVLAHEISHIANGDMVTLTLIQGTLNSFVYIISRVLGYALASRFGRDRSTQRTIFRITYFLTSIVLMLGATVIVRWFSRQREYRADAGAASLVGPQKMIAALYRLKSQAEPQLPENMEAMGISGRASALFSTHPKLDDRIAALMSPGR